MGVVTGRADTRTRNPFRSGGYSVKATTNEKMGFLGREEGISAMAVATVEQMPDPTFYPNI